MKKLEHYSYISKLIIILKFSFLSLFLNGQSSFTRLGYNGVVPVSHAFGLSGDGSVVVGQSQALAFRWSENDGMVNIGTLVGYNYSSAFSTNYDGTIVVGSSSRRDENLIGCFWQDGIIKTIGFPNDSSYSNVVYDISDYGSILVGYDESSNGKKAFKWQNGQFTFLEDLSGESTYSIAVAVSGDGSKVVGVSEGEAFLWSENIGMIGLGALSNNYFYSFATGISSDGATVIGFSTTKNISQFESEFGSFRWTESGGLTNIGLVYEDSQSSIAEAISGDGQVIVGREYRKDGEKIGYIWTEKNGVQSFKNLLETEKKLDLSGWSLYPQDISNDGSIIVGYGLNPDGNEEGWLVKLETEPTSTNFQKNLVSGDFNLYQNYPNPFNPTTTIDFEIAERGFVRMVIYDLLGNRVAQVLNETHNAGKHKLLFDGSHLSSGIYYYSLITSTGSMSKKFLLLK